MRTEGILAVPAQAHGSDGNAGEADTVNERLLLCGCPVQTAQPRVCLVDADLQTVKSAFVSAGQHLVEAEAARYCLFIQREAVCRILLRHRASSFFAFHGCADAPVSISACMSAQSGSSASIVLQYSAYFRL
jgi:hypothetical protein